MASSRNRLLSSLSTGDFDLLAPHLQSVTLELRKMLEKPNKSIEAVYFPETGFASVVAIQRGGKEVEVGLIGREGMTGLPIVLGNHRSPHAIYIQASGKGHCIPARELRQAMQASLSLRDVARQSGWESVLPHPEMLPRPTGCLSQNAPGQFIHLHPTCRVHRFNSLRTCCG